MRRHRHRRGRGEHETDGQKPDRTDVGPELPERGEERRRPEDRRKEDEEDDVRLQLRQVHPGDETDRGTGEHLQDRRRNRQTSRQRRERDDKRGKGDREDNRGEVRHRGGDRWTAASRRLVATGQ